MNPCPCGKPWDLDHYDPETRAYIDAQVREHGETVSVTIGTRTWLVSRYCIAYHGITGKQLLSGRSGFPEVV